MIAAIEKAVDPDGNPNTDDGVQVINLSLGGSGDPDDPVSQAVDNAVSAGVVVVVAAGNAGPGYDTVGSPGSARLALTVGASEKIDQMASFSSRGPAPKTYQIKPEITAPGVGIRSTVPRGTCPLCGSSGYAPLNGTSMATPHVAGAVALLLEKNPDWTPPRIKEVLMERSVDLAADVFTQGSGRVDAYASMTRSTVVSPANLSLGLDPTDLPVFQVTQTLNITNDGISPETYALSVKGTFPPGMTASVTPASIALTPGQATSFTFTLTVNNTLVPDPTNPTHSYAGTIVALGEGEILRIPFAVLKSPALEIAFDEEPLILAVHNRSNLVKYIAEPGNPRTLLLPKGTYDVIAIFSDNVTRVIREGIPLAGKASVNISKGEAVHPFKIIPVDQNGNRLPLSPRTMMMSYFKHKTARFTDATFYWGMPPSFQFSDVSDSYSFEVSRLEQ